MNIILRIEPPIFADLTSHLLPPNSTQEEAAFLFATRETVDGGLNFRVIEVDKMVARDFVTQQGDYLELTDEARARVIKRAHDLETSLVEIHSHLGTWPAAFSQADRVGLKETVPHMWWRLRQRPYLAIVMTAAAYDALAWVDSAKNPVPLSGLLVGDRLLKPTNRSLGGWG